MTQHPFEREFSEQEAAKLNAEQDPTAELELTDEDADQVAGGILPPSITKAITMAIGEEGGGISVPMLESGIS